MEIIVEHGFIRDSVIANTKNRKTFMAGEKRRISREGKTPIKATYDKAGDCVFCGEAGRCPGWHTANEIKTLLSRYETIDW